MVGFVHLEINDEIHSVTTKIKKDSSPLKGIESFNVCCISFYTKTLNIHVLSYHRIQGTDNQAADLLL